MKKKLSKGIRKMIRMKKAEIRRSADSQAEADKEIQALLEKIAPEQE